MAVSELLGGAIGTLLLGLGIASVVAWSSRRRPIDRVLLYFGLWTGIYGARLIVEQSTISAAMSLSPVHRAYVIAFATYTINVPVGLFFEALIGQGWKRSIRIMWTIQAVYAAGAIATDLCLQRPLASMALNSPLVLIGALLLIINLWKYREILTRTVSAPVISAGALVMLLFIVNENMGRPVYRASDLEPLGVFAFVLTLGYGVVTTAFRRESELVAVQRELALARQIQASLLPRELPLVAGLDLAARYLPMTAVAGDLYDVVALGTSHVGILVADVSGHGVPAALVASMVKLAFSTQSEHAHDPAHVLGAINRILYRAVEGTFVTAVYAVIDTASRTITVANAGHPPLLAGGSNAKVSESNARGLMLGVLPDAQYENDQLTLHDGDYVLLYTDGIPESQTPNGDFLDLDRVRGWLRSTDDHNAASFADAALARLRQWRGSPTFEDDVTLVVARFVER